MNTCPNCGKVEGGHSSILQGCMCQYSMQAPPQRTWVGLSDEEIWSDGDSFVTSEVGIKQFARAIEAKLKEKNT